MADPEKTALGRVLMISKKTYSAVQRGEQLENLVMLLDNLSATLSHVNDENKPVSKLIGSLKRVIKSSNRSFYPTVKLYFGKIYPAPDFDYETALKHIPAIIHGNDAICTKAVRGEWDKVKSMCAAMTSYPGFIFGEFKALSSLQFYDLVFGYYPKIYEEDFMGEMKHLFE